MCESVSLWVGSIYAVCIHGKIFFWYSFVWHFLFRHIIVSWPWLELLLTMIVWVEHVSLLKISLCVERRTVSYKTCIEEFEWCCGILNGSLLSIFPCKGMGSVISHLFFNQSTTTHFYTCMRIVHTCNYNNHLSNNSPDKTMANLLQSSPNLALHLFNQSHRGSGLSSSVENWVTIILLYYVISYDECNHMFFEGFNKNGSSCILL